MWCKSCKAVKSKQYYHDNLQQCRDKVLQYSREHKEDRYTWRDQNPEKYLLVWAKHRAKKKGIPFSLRPEDIEVPEFCPVLGIKLQFSRMTKATDNSPTIDRIIPSLGYVAGNVVVISKRANRIKGDARLGELQKITAWLENELTFEQNFTEMMAQKEA